MSTARAVLAAAGLLAAIGGCGGSGERVAATQRPAETLSPLTRRALPGVPGKTFTSAIVAFPPAARAAPHRHGDAFVYAYVLDGSVASRLAGERRHVYHEGEDWIERPGADHVLTENTSRTAPAKLLVVFVSDTGAPLKVDDPRR